MEYIDISTSHNISIRYELATVLQRIFAWLLDFMILIVYSILVSFITGSNTVLNYVLIFLVFAFYHLACEILNNGQSVGKRIMKLKVVTLHGRTAKPQDYFLRWVFRILEITFTLGTMAVLYVMSTEKHQRIGDLLAQTTVVKLRPDAYYDLHALLKLNTEDRQITYPKLTMYNDTDMMLVKDAINRLKSDPTKVNKQFVTTLTDRLSTDLDLDKRVLDPASFLETVLLDYIAITR